MSVNHVSLKFAGVTDGILDEVVREYDRWAETGFVEEDAYLRHLSGKFGSSGTPLAMLAAALLVFREILARQERKATQDKPEPAGKAKGK